MVFLTIIVGLPASGKTLLGKSIPSTIFFDSVFNGSWMDFLRAGIDICIADSCLCLPEVWKRTTEKVLEILDRRQIRLLLLENDPGTCILNLDGEENIGERIREIEKLSAFYDFAVYRDWSPQQISVQIKRSYVRQLSRICARNLTRTLRQRQTLYQSLCLNLPDKKNTSFSDYQNSHLAINRGLLFLLSFYFISHVEMGRKKRRLHFFFVGFPYVFTLTACSDYFLANCKYHQLLPASSGRYVTGTLNYLQQKSISSFRIEENLLLIQCEEALPYALLIRNISNGYLTGTLDPLNFKK